MTEYIDRKALLKDIAKIGGSSWSEWETAGVRDVVTKQPAADVAPVRHGQAFYLDDFANAGWYCDQCHKKHPKKPKFCSNCGAKLDLEAQHE